MLNVWKWLLKAFPITTEVSAACSHMLTQLWEGYKPLQGSVLNFTRGLIWLESDEGTKTSAAVGSQPTGRRFLLPNVFGSVGSSVSSIPAAILAESSWFVVCFSQWLWVVKMWVLRTKVQGQETFKTFPVNTLVFPIFPTILPWSKLNQTYTTYVCRMSRFQSFIGQSHNSQLWLFKPTCLFSKFNERKFFF